MARTLELMEYPPMMNVAEVAKYLRVGKHAVYRACKEQRMPSIMVAGKLRIIRDKLPTWVEECTS
jgi:excisionase family DNA binding protein